MRSPEVGAIFPGDFDNEFMAVGSGEFTTIVDGEFTYAAGQPSGVLEIQPTRTGTVIAAPNVTLDGIRGVLPEAVVGTSLRLVGIPESTSAVLSCLALLGVGLVRRRV